jgi:hypothetical protein
MAARRRERDTLSREEDVMAKYTGGEKVGGGYYWNTRSWEVEVVGAEGGRLGDPDGARYVKVHFLALFVIVPLLGALLLVSLPLIGFALFAYAIARRLTGAVGKGTTELAATVQPGRFAAGTAYFTGKPGEEEAAAKKDGAGASGSTELEKLEQEIASRKEK